MTAPFRPHLDILPEPQRRLWPELAGVPDEFALYGGTAIALRLGHRQSVDFDFFAPRPIDPRALLEDLTLLQGCVVLEVEPNTLTVAVERGGSVKLSFFGVPRLGQVEPFDHAKDNGLAVARLLDLGGTKVSVVQVRAEAKDYIDLDALMRAGLELPRMLAAAEVLYGPTFSPQAALKAMTYFDDPGLSDLPDELKDRIRRQVRSVDPLDLPVLTDVVRPRST